MKFLFNFTYFNDKWVIIKRKQHRHNMVVNYYGGRPIKRGWFDWISDKLNEKLNEKNDRNRI